MGGAVELRGLADLHAVADTDRTVQARAGPDDDSVAQRAMVLLAARDRRALSHRQLPAYAGIAERSIVREFGAVGESGSLIDLNLHRVADLDIMTPGGFAEQPAAGTDPQPVAEGALQPAARSDDGIIADDRARLELCGLADGGLRADTPGVADLCPVLDLTGLPDRGTRSEERREGKSGSPRGGRMKK